ncbi:RNA-guided endonuclease InsQ/TnpB family protein [Desulfofundulus thermosubterraneus]|uniref:Probable transposase n=1 Tax=Desulfofundulus thermosubterraneus DSM 16057 TaxID=1121432 RepID=A0A1M6JDP7_9FIRM|nr:zinc ribbon domain-containing protein [Desulfofundulus thermosubterraneus]SHJ44805.1 Probable transposase [Desulfofundulus thermosubterraneus DSM 16057]
MILTTSVRLPNEFVGPVKTLVALGLKLQEQALRHYWSLEGLEKVAAHSGQIWKLLDAEMSRPEDVYIPSRPWRCILESAGRILRSQAERKRIFEHLLPFFAGGAKNAARKLYEEFKAEGNPEKFGYLLNVAEQLAEFYAGHERLPQNFFEFQRKPEPKRFTYTLAPDDGAENGQAIKYCLEGNRLAGEIKLPVVPEPRSKKDWQWLSFSIELPAELQEKLAAGGTLCAPDLRLKVKPDGELVALLDAKVDVPEEKPSGDPGRALSVDWGLRKLVTCTVVSRKGQLTPPFFVFWSGLKARLFRIRDDIKKLQKERDRYEKGTSDWKKYNRKIAAAWQKYHRVQHALAHAVSTLLVLLARAFGCRHIFVEWLVTLRGKKGRNRDLNWWVSTVVRGLLFRLLRYKAKLAGIRVFMVPPGGTSRVCPRCLGAGKHVISPGNKTEKDSGSWFVCPSCGWQADRDYAGSLNIARVGFSLARPLSYKVGGAAMPFPSRVASAEAMTFTTTLSYVRSVFFANIGCLVKLLSPDYDIVTL